MRKRLFGTRKRTILSIVTVLALIAVSAAFAAWYVGSGSGPGAAQGGSTQHVDLLVSAQPGVLRPGHECLPNSNCDLGISVSNPGPAMTLQGVSFAGPASVDGDASCAIASHLTLNPAPAAALASGATSSVLLGDVLHADGTLPECAAAHTWTVPLAITAQ